MKSIDYSLNFSNTEEDIMIRLISSIILSYKHLISNYSIRFHLRVDIFKYDNLVTNEYTKREYVLIINTHGNYGGSSRLIRTPRG